jgi:hypothetical protein
MCPVLHQVQCFSGGEEIHKVQDVHTIYEELNPYFGALLYMPWYDRKDIPIKMVQFAKSQSLE